MTRPRDLPKLPVGLSSRFQTGCDAARGSGWFKQYANPILILYKSQVKGLKSLSKSRNMPESLTCKRG